MSRHVLLLAWKVLLRRKAFTAISLVGVSLTLVVLTIATAALEHVFGDRPPEVAAERTLGVYGVAMIGDQRSRTGFPGYRFLDLHVRDLPGVEATTFFRQVGYVTAASGDARARVYLKRTDAAFWDVLRFDFVEGRPLDATDESGARPVAVVNRSTRERFWGDSSALGREIEVDGVVHAVVGVVEDVPFLRPAPFADVWVPLATSLSDGWRDEWTGDFQALLLAESRDRLPGVRAELASRVAAARPDAEGYHTLHAGAETLFEYVSRELFSRRGEASHAGRLRLFLATLALLFMLLPAVNLTNVNLSRAVEREAEIGVRRAFGARRGDLVVQLLVENLVLTLVGAALGFALSAAALAAVDASGLVPYSDFQVNLTVFAWGVVLAGVFAVLSGVWPAWRVARLHPVEALRGRAL